MWLDQIIWLLQCSESRKFETVIGCEIDYGLTGTIYSHTADACTR